MSLNKKLNRTKILRLCLYVLVPLHSAIVATNVAAFFVVPFVAPWYLWVPICTMIGRVICVRNACPLTIWENRIRSRLGMNKIDGFVQHYFLR